MSRRFNYRIVYKVQEVGKEAYTDIIDTVRERNERRALVYFRKKHGSKYYYIRPTKIEQVE